jgi:hypothetical protein
MVGAHVGHRLFRRLRLTVRPRYDTGRAVIGPEVVDHENEAEQRPVGRLTLHVDVQLLVWRARAHRAPDERAELEGAAYHAAASIQQRRKEQQGLEYASSIGETGKLRARTADANVIATC